MTTFLLETNPVDSGTAWYMLFFNATGACWNGAAYATYTTDRDTFDVPMTEVGAGLGVYALPMPALPAGETYWAYYKRIGVTPAHATDTRYKVGAGYCDGSNIVSQTGDTYTKVDTEVAAIKAKTDNLPGDPADASDIAASFASLATTLSTLAGYVDTEVGAIKAKTDALPATPAAVSDIPAASDVAAAVRADLATTLAVPLLSRQVVRASPLLQATAGQEIILGTLVHRDTLDRLTTGAQLSVAVDATPTTAAGDLAYGDDGCWRYTPALAEVAGTRLQLSLDHADAIQPLVVDATLVPAAAWQNLLTLFDNAGVLSSRTISELTTPKTLQVTLGEA
jgi:hypothetical protein